MPIFCNFTTKNRSPRPRCGVFGHSRNLHRAGLGPGAEIIHIIGSADAEAVGLFQSAAEGGRRLGGFGQPQKTDLTGLEDLSGLGYKDKRGCSHLVCPFSLVGGAASMFRSHVQAVPPEGVGSRGLDPTYELVCISQSTVLAWPMPGPTKYEG